ncbi:MAG: hypothetical protein WCW44_01530 [archaeon]|jgi:hypothetical protein
MVKSKYLLFVVVCVVASLFLFGCSVKIWPPLNVAQCEQLPDFAGLDEKHTKDECYSYLAVKNKDVSLCSKVYNDSTNCIARVAVDSNNLELCSSITENPKSSDYCYYQLSLSKLENNCDKVLSPSMRNTCLFKVAVAKKDSSLCSAMDLDSGISSIEQISMDLCFDNIAKSTSSFELCSKIEEKILHKNCLDSFLRNSLVGKSELDQAMCQLYTDKDSQQACSAVFDNNILECEQIEDLMVHNYNCIISLAIKQSNTVLCEKMRNETWCIYPEPCKSVATDFECYDMYAQTKLDPSICQKITNEHSDTRDMCYGNIAYNLNDTNLCGQIVNKSFGMPFCSK